MTKGKSKKKRQKKERKELKKFFSNIWEWMKKNKKAVAIFSIFIIGFISGGVVFTIVGEEEIELTPVGFAVASYTELGGISSERDYVNLEEGTETLDQSTWHEGIDASNRYSVFRADSKSIEIDPDLSTMGTPNIIANIPQNYYSCDASGNIIDEFDVSRIDRSFYDPTVDAFRDITFYNTWVGSQMTITIKADQDIEVESFGGTGDKIGQASTAEVDGEYNRLSGYATDTSFYGAGIWCRMVFRTNIKAFAVGEAIHDDPYTDSWNGVWWTKITRVNVDEIESTQGWQGTGAWSGNLEQTEIGIYATIEDALFGNNQIPDRDANSIQLENTLQSHVYFALEYQVRLGYDFNTQKYIGDGWVEDWANTPLKIQGWKITLDLVQYITTSYGAPFESGHTQEIVYENPFEHEALPDISGLGWFSNIWSNPTYRRIIIIGGIVIVAVIAIIIIVKVAPMMIARRASRPRPRR